MAARPDEITTKFLLLTAKKRCEMRPIGKMPNGDEAIHRGHKRHHQDEATKRQDDVTSRCRCRLRCRFVAVIVFRAGCILFITNKKKITSHCVCIWMFAHWVFMLLQLITLRTYPINQSTVSRKYSGIRSSLTAARCSLLMMPFAKYIFL